MEQRITKKNNSQLLGDRNNGSIRYESHILSLSGISIDFGDIIKKYGIDLFRYKNLQEEKIMDICYEIRLDADKWESQSDMVRERCFQKFGSPIYCHVATDLKSYWLRTTKLDEIQLASELLHRGYIEKKFVRNDQNRLDSSRGFTWGT